MSAATSKAPGGIRILIPALLAVACDQANPAVNMGTVLPVVAAEAADVERADARTSDTAVLCVDTARSLVRWKGTEPVGSGHEGVVRLQGGQLRLEGGRVAGGLFTVDMRTITVTDMPRHEVEARRKLRSHLAHEEFFGVARFPTARFMITDVTPGEGPRYTVSGNLAIRDSVHNVTFEAWAPVVSDDSLRATAAFSFDRYLWGIDFDGVTSVLRNALVDDLIQLKLILVASPTGCNDDAGGDHRAGGAGTMRPDSTTSRPSTSARDRVTSVWPVSTRSPSSSTSR